MKSSRINKLILLCLLALGGSFSSFSQDSFKADGFSIRLSPGVLSFHGDMSTNRYNPVKILQENSKLGFGLAAIKEFNDWIGIQAEYTTGNLYSVNHTYEKSFSGSISEFGVAARFAPLGLNQLKDKTKIQLYITLGLSTFGYRSCLRNDLSNDIILPCYGYEDDGVTWLPRKNSLAIPIGLGVSFPVNSYLSIDLDHTYRITNTDVLDAFLGNTGKNDWYSHTSVGIRFRIKSPDPRTIFPNLVDDEPIDDSIDIDDRIEEIEHQAMNVFIESQVDDVVNSGEVFAVRLRINKGSYTGPARLVQRYPEGFTALESSSTNGRFSFRDRNVLIEWDKMPVDSMISYTYYVRTLGTVVGSQTVTGRFEFEEKGKWNTVRFNNYIFVDNSLGISIDNDTKDQVVKVVTETIVEKPKVDPPVKTDIQTKTDPFLTMVPKVDIEFRVQCGAFKDSNKGGLKLAERYGITEDMREVYENGWYKYTVGSFKSYKEAVEFKEAFIKRTKLFTAFVVAYKNGKRVLNINDAFR